jgi:pimeloyl-ACP methyl ester carboxylesterase
MTALAAALLVTAPLLTGCSQSGDRPEPTSSGSPSGSAPSVTSSAAAQAPTPGLRPFYGQNLAWTDCGGGFQCAQLAVPLDYAKPSGEQIKISVTRLPATGERLGSIVVNPGGPGASGVQYARSATSILSADVRERFDVVGFDPRGVGDSAPIRCLTSARLDHFVGLDATPDTPAEVKDLEAGAREFAKGCEAKSAALLPHVGTADAARDMDVLRAALGDKGLTYLGKSYGTYLGAVYADLFPKRVRALVLDGALDPSLTPVETNEEQGRGFERAFKAFLEDCFDDESCPFTSRDVDGALKEFKAFLERVDEHPLSSTLGDGREVSEAWAILGVVTPLYDRESWPVLRQALAEAFKGDGTVLLRIADLMVDRHSDGTYSNQTAANTAINCVDHPYPRTLSAYQQAAAASAKESPRFGEYIMWGSLPCAYWPVKTTAKDKPLHADGAPPIVVVGTERDPATPYEWAKALASQLKSGVLISYNGDGHTAYDTGSTCVDRLVDDYLINQTPPADGTRCPKVH